MSRLWIDEALDSLGESSEDVAKALYDAGCRGRKSDACRCPVAIYLADLGYDASVDSNTVVDENTGEEFLVPEAVCEFIVDFDGGRYPELDLS